MKNCVGRWLLAPASSVLFSSAGIRFATSFQSILKAFKVFFNTKIGERKKIKNSHSNRSIVWFFVPLVLLVHVSFSYFISEAILFLIKKPFQNHGSWNRNSIPNCNPKPTCKVLEYMEYLSQCDIYSSVNWIKNQLLVIASQTEVQIIKRKNCKCQNDYYKCMRCTYICVVFFSLFFISFQWYSTIFFFDAFLWYQNTSIRHLLLPKQAPLYLYIFLVNVRDAF